jgi:3-hydroxyisobutyrate dehydrogenase-like beta-hydroxyacid dehydrogenase
MKTIGVIGLGLIGASWARNYAADGVLAGSWNRTPHPDAPAWREAPEAVAAAADAIQIVVADPPAVDGVLARILPQLGPGKVVVQSSTIDPASSTKFAERVTATGARYLEAPFTGSKVAAEKRQTVFYLGGDRALMAELDPLLARISSHRFIIGTHEQACTLKLAMNLNVAAQMEGLSEALTLARRGGVSDDVFFSALGKNVGYSGLTKLKEPGLRAHDFAPQFSIKHLHKDMRLASRTAACADFPVLEAVRELLKTAEARGLGDEDFSAMIRLLEEE